MVEKISGGWFRSLFKPRPTEAHAAAPSAASVSNQASAPTPYHAVSIVPGEQSCAASYRFTGHRFLSRQAPKLPLPTCDAFHCTCRFKHHNDRRAGPRRRDDIGLMSTHYPGRDRRGPRGRRSTDK